MSPWAHGRMAHPSLGRCSHGPNKVEGSDGLTQMLISLCCQPQVTQAEQNNTHDRDPTRPEPGGERDNAAAEHRPMARARQATSNGNGRKNRTHPPQIRAHQILCWRLTISGHHVDLVPGGNNFTCKQHHQDPYLHCSSTDKVATESIQLYRKGVGSHERTCKKRG